MKYESTIRGFSLLPRTWRVASIAVLLGTSIIVSTLQAQEATPTPTPAPEATMTEVRDEIVSFRRLVIIMGGISLGWSTCLLIFKYH
jgi:hypothetical protein